MFNNNCNNNRCCFDPCECQPEPCCCIGATGSQGATGPTGPTGPAGIATLGAYGTFVHIGQQTLFENGPVPLNSASVYSNLIFNAGGTTVTIVNTGIYRITYNIYLVHGHGVVEVGLLVNGVMAPNTLIRTTEFDDIASGVTTLSLSTGSTIQITVLFPNPVELRNDTSAFLDIIRVA